MIATVLRFGNTVLQILIPENVSGAMLPAWLQSFSGDVLPSINASIILDHYEQAPAESVDVSRAFGFQQARMVGDHDLWRIYAHLPKGPSRPDALPSRFVIPAVLTVLAQHGVTALHASAVLHHECAILFAGASGSGKSTMADQCVKAGCGFFADDRVLVWMSPDGIRVTPSFEIGNPFGRWVGHRPETGSRPPTRRTPPCGQSAKIARIFFPQVSADEISNAVALSPAETYVQTAKSAIGEWAPSIDLDAHRLILGRNSGSIVEWILERTGG